MSTIPDDSAWAVLDVTSEVRISTTPDRAWQCLVHELSSWWPEGFWTNPKTKRFALEPRLGGVAYEDWGDGDGLVWYVVTALQRGKLLHLAGDLHPGFGGPARVFTRFHVEPDGDGCVVKLLETYWGSPAANLAKEAAGGWKVSLSKLKAWCERPAG